MHRSPEQQAETWTVEKQELLRRPLEHAWAVDPKYCSEADDAIAVEQTGDFTFIAKVHVADAGLLSREATILSDARALGWSEYALNGDAHTFMLPPAVHSLGLDNNHYGLGTPATTLAFELDTALMQTKVIDIYKSRVICNAMSYEEFDVLLAQGDPQARLLETCASYLNRVTDAAGTFPEQDHSKQVIAEYMIVANRLIAQQMRLHQVPWLYRNHSTVVPQSLRDPDISSLVVGVFDFMAAAGRGTYGTTPLLHEGLGFEPYSHFTSPLRRFADLVNHLTLDALLRGEKLPFTQVELNQIATELAEKSALKIQEIARSGLRLIVQRSPADNISATVLLN